MTPKRAQEAGAAFERALELAAALGAELLAVEFGEARTAKLRFWVGTETQPGIMSETVELRLNGPAMGELRRRLGLG